MHTSDSEDFESADEGHDTLEKKDRKKRISSSNYSDNVLESDQKAFQNEAPKCTEQQPAADVAGKEGWDDFDIDEKELFQPEPITNSNKVEKEMTHNTTSKDKPKSQDTGWDDFDDWGENDNSNIISEANQKSVAAATTDKDQVKLEHDIKSVTDRLASAPSGTGWGWGWSVDSLLSTATAGISSITNQVSQGLSTVLETGIGAPDPEELARRKLQEREEESNKVEKPPIQEKLHQEGSSEDSFQLGNLLSGVTKFVETTSTKVIAGGLDTLETIGKKTMEVLQDGDPGLAKKRAMFGLGAGDKPVLSQVLREAKAKSDEEDKIREEKREAKEVHYENLFDDFEGLVHLEALEMLSRQVNMRIEERLRAAAPEKRQDIKETLQQVAELCEMPEEDEEEESSGDDVSKPDAFHERLQTATQDLGIKLQFQPLVKQYKEILEQKQQDGEVTVKATYKRAVSGLAQATALSVEQYHKAAELLLVKTRRSTADEADALTQMTTVLTKHISELASLFTEKLNNLQADDNKEQINNYITNIFLEAGNSSSYIQNAFQLALPILQIGAV